MAHKLAELKTIYRIEFSANPPTLAKEGDIDTSGMAENGNLASGNHKPFQSRAARSSIKGELFLRSLTRAARQGRSSEN
jgi:hypothetical protein